MRIIFCVMVTLCLCHTCKMQHAHLFACAARIFRKNELTNADRVRLVITFVILSWLPLFRFFWVLLSLHSVISLLRHHSAEENAWAARHFLWNERFIDMKCHSFSVNTVMLISLSEVRPLSSIFLHLVLSIRQIERTLEVHGMLPTEREFERLKQRRTKFFVEMSPYC